MARITLDVEKVLKLYPELQGFESDGRTDFNRISTVVGSREADLVWGIHRCLTTPTLSKTQSDRLGRLKAKIKS